VFKRRLSASGQCLWSSVASVVLTWRLFSGDKSAISYKRNVVALPHAQDLWYRQWTSVLVRSGHGGGAKRNRRYVSPARWVGKRRFATCYRKKMKTMLSHICKCVRRFCQFSCISLSVVPFEPPINPIQHFCERDRNQKPVLKGSLAHALGGDAGGSASNNKRALLDGVTKLFKQRCGADLGKKDMSPKTEKALFIHTILGSKWLRKSKCQRTRSNMIYLYNDLVTVVNTCRNGNSSGLPS